MTAPVTGTRSTNDVPNPVRDDNDQAAIPENLTLQPFANPCTGSSTFLPTRNPAQKSRALLVREFIFLFGVRAIPWKRWHLEPHWCLRRVRCAAI